MVDRKEMSNSEDTLRYAGTTMHALAGVAFPPQPTQALSHTAKSVNALSVEMILYRCMHGHCHAEHTSEQLIYTAIASTLFAVHMA